MTFDFHIGMSKFDVRIYNGTQCWRSMKPKYIFTSFLLYVISFPSYSSSCYL
jgi:hypothetical protein